MAGQAQRAALLEEGSALSAGGEALRVELAAAREVLFLLLLSRSVDLRWYSGGQQLFGGASLSLSPVPAPWWGEDWAAREKERARGQEAPAAQTVSAGQGVAEREREREAPAARTDVAGEGGADLMWAACGEALRVELASAREGPARLGTALPGYPCCGG